jgi:hypothetical protein
MPQGKPHGKLEGKPHKRQQSEVQNSAYRPTCHLKGKTCNTQAFPFFIWEYICFQE